MTTKTTTKKSGGKRKGAGRPKTGLPARKVRGYSISDTAYKQLRALSRHYKVSASSIFEEMIKDAWSAYIEGSSAVAGDR